jgi:hypothetical protein
MKCEDCKYYEHEIDAAEGECHRLPPKTFMMPESNWEYVDDPEFFNFVYPLVTEGDWCGEFQKKAK